MKIINSVNSVNSTKIKNIWVLLIVSLLSIALIYFTFSWAHYLVKNNYIVECFVSRLKDTGSPDTNHTVNMPINTTQDCKNMCGSQSRCYISGQQCTSDVDCQGCQPLFKEDGPSSYKKDYRGENDAGKLTWGQTPTYSTLTTDIGTQSKLYDGEKSIHKRAPDYNKGVNTWYSIFKKGEKAFDERYKDNTQENQYPKRYSLSGEYVDDGPLASNAYL